MVTPPQPLLGAAQYSELLDNYAWTRIERLNQTLRARQAVTLFERPVSGFLAFVLLKTTDPDTMVVVDLYGDGSFDIVLSPKLLYALGFTSWNNYAGIVTRYDAINDQYVALFTPSPWIPFNGMARILIRNPSMEDIQYSFVAWIYERKG